MALTIAEKASRTDVGRQRQSNEDSYLERSPLFAVADGMGGARAGEVASRLAVEAFDERPEDGRSPEEQLAGVVRAANRQIYTLAQENSAHAGMGTTLTAALVSGREVAVAHVGDSRLYRLRDGKLERLTDDHSLVEEFVRQGKLTPEEAEVHPQRSIITRALGPEPDVQVDTHTHSGLAGDVYLICSDGLTGMVSEPQLAEILAGSASLEDAAGRMIAAANAAGGKDNITVVLFRLAADDSPQGAADDTLAGQDTDAGGIPAEDVREALAADGGKRGGAPTATRARPAMDDTVAIGAAEAAAARSGEEPDGKAAEGPAPGAPAASPAKPPRRRLTRRARIRRTATAALVAVAVAAVIVGAYVGSRQFWYVGTNGQGYITVYRGLPWNLPLGISLHTVDHVSKVQASSITDARRRSNITNNQLRSHGDAIDLVHQVEASQRHR